MSQLPARRYNGKVIEGPDASDESSKGVNLHRARRRHREIAEQLNPSPFVVVIDTRGRPRHAPRHTSVKV